MISQLGPGDVFGVMSTLTGDRVTADVIAGNRCFVLLIPLSVFNTQILTNPKAVGYLSRLLLDRMRTMSVDLVAGHSSAVSKSTTPTPCPCTPTARARWLVLNVGISQIHFGIYDTQDLGSDVHGIIDNADDCVSRISVVVGTQVKTLARDPFPSPSCSG